MRLEFDAASGRRSLVNSAGRSLFSLGVTESHVFSTWTKRKQIVAALLVSVPIVGFVVFFAVIVIDGEGYDRWRNVQELRRAHDAWVRDGSPEPPDVAEYASPSLSRTTFVYAAFHVIDGQTYTGLFGHRSYSRFGTFVITRTGEVIVVDKRGRARLAKIHKTRAAAW